MERCEEKARKDYNGDGARVVDLLRGCVILNDDMKEVRAAYAYLEDLKQRGVIDIVQNKNRYIEGPTMTGYLDANCLIRYKGFLSEVQIIVSGIYSLKGEQTPLYNLARSLGLVGPLQPEYAMLMEGAAVGKDRVRPPRSTRVLLVALRAVAMLGASFPSMFYPWFCFLFQSYFGVDVMAGIYGIQLRLPVWTVYGLALAIPNLILGCIPTGARAPASQMTP